MRVTREQALALGVPEDELPPKEVDRSRRSRKVTGESPLQIALRGIINANWPGQFVEEHRGAVPGRQYRLDMACPDIRLAIECQGFEFHGRFKSGFQRDCERQNDLAIHGWTVIQFTASDLFKRPDHCADVIRSVVNRLRSEG